MKTDHIPLNPVAPSCATSLSLSLHPSSVNTDHLGRSNSCRPFCWLPCRACSCSSSLLSCSPGVQEGRALRSRRKYSAPTRVPWFVLAHAVCAPPHAPSTHCTATVDEEPPTLHPPRSFPSLVQLYLSVLLAAVTKRGKRVPSESAVKEAGAIEICLNRCGADTQPEHIPILDAAKARGGGRQLLGG